MHWPGYKKLLFLFHSSIITLTVVSQSANSNWQQLFDLPFDKRNIATQVLWDSLSKKPFPEIESVLKQLENDNRNNTVAWVKLDLLRTSIAVKNGSYRQNEWRHWGTRALQQATKLQDDYLMESCCQLLGDRYLQINNYDTGLFYTLKCIELADRLHYQEDKMISLKIAASNALYHTRNYRQCLDFCKILFGKENLMGSITVVSAYNNSGLSLLQLNKPDSAIYFFSKGVDYARQIKWGIWEAILSGNIGDALHVKGQDEEAMPYWQMDYDSSIQYGDKENAGLTLSYMSEQQFAANPQKAITQLQWAQAANTYDPINLLRIYKIKYNCYRKLGMQDSANYFLEKHYHIADSVNAVINRNNYNTVQLKLDYDNSLHEAYQLKKERQGEIIKRNFLLITLAFLLLFGLLFYNRQRLKTKLAKQEKEIAEAEKNSVKEQLAIFTQTLLDKNDQIDQLNNSLRQQNTAAADELIHQTLLTDYDWNRFKELFEKLHPSFFGNLKNAAPGITPSEMRLAALIKLNLDNKQMASMQGISVSSVRGNKTRLRQKLNVAAETVIEDFIKQL